MLTFSESFWFSRRVGLKGLRTSFQELTRNMKKHTFHKWKILKFSKYSKRMYWIIYSTYVSYI